MRTGAWILDDEGEAVECDGSVNAWAQWYETAQTQIADDRVGDVRVSTIFLGLNLGYGYGPPLVFETMVFGGEDDQQQRRYTTRTEALRGHAEVLAEVLARHAGKGTTTP